MRRVFINLCVSILMVSLSSCDSDNDDVLTRSIEKQYVSSSTCFDLAAPSDAYIYPIAAGTSEWSSLSNDEQVRLTTIPFSMLNKMSTSGLIISLFDHPLFPMFTFSDNWAESFDNTIKVLCSNIYQEMINRADVGNSLLQLYKVYNPNSKDNKASCTLHVHDGILLLSSMPEFYGKFTKAEKKDFLRTALEKNMSQVSLIKQAGSNDTDNPVSINVGGFIESFVNIMLSENYEPMLKYVEENRVNANVWEVYPLFDIITMAESFIND